MRTMNPKIKSKLLKLRAKNGGMDIFYSYTNWATNEIDGITFIPVVKSPNKDENQVIHYMRKDNMEVVR